MRYLRYAFLASLAFVLVLLAVANREMTTLSLLPAELNDIAPFAFSPRGNGVSTLAGRTMDKDRPHIGCD